MEKIKSRLVFALGASLTLGLAPFSPPHIWEKIMRLYHGGAKHFQPIDWFDVVMHGSPWVFLMVFSIQYIQAKKRAGN
jgi:hypothetical protein